MKKELLSPAGDFEALRAAVNNGADAVYLAGKNYGARKFAKNFSLEELAQAVNYAHLYGVKVYVTVNTIIYEEEIKEVLEYIEYLNNIGVDALIVQDIGLMVLIRKYFPDLDIHASTQAHTHNIEQIKFLEKLGVKRVVLAREMSLKDINKLDTKMELEVFIHGALCICYSGQCLFSAFKTGRSGNRGECAGLCRVLYDLKCDDKNIIHNQYLLSPKELNTTNYGLELNKSRVLSFKIEGRMKSPEYVGYVTRIYRKILDDVNYKLTEEEIFNLKSLYNRGFTKGYLFNNSDKEFISLKSSNHLGVEIGDVISFNKKRIRIKLNHELNQGDAIRLPNQEGMYVNFLYNKRDELINKAKKDDIVEVQNKVVLEQLGKVYLTFNKKLKEQIDNGLKKQIGINIYGYAHENEKLIIKYTDLANEVIYEGDIVSKAKSMPISKERIGQILSKLGNTPFKVNNLDLDIADNIFIPVGYLNEIRRELVQKLEDKRCRVREPKKLALEELKVFKRNNKKIKISALARNEEQLKALINNKVDYIYLTDEYLMEKYGYLDNIYLRLDRVIEQHKDYFNTKLLIGETGSLKYCTNNEVVSDYFLNVVNSSYGNLLASMKVKRITISPELKLDQINDFIQHLDNKIEVEIIGYGSLEYMIMKYNLINNMELDANKDYYLENKMGTFKILKDKYTHIMGDKKINLINNIKDLKKLGIDVFRLELLDENTQDINNLIKQIKKELG